MGSAFAGPVLSGVGADPHGNWSAKRDKNHEGLSTSLLHLSWGKLVSATKGGFSGLGLLASRAVAGAVFSCGRRRGLLPCQAGGRARLPRNAPLISG